MENFTINNIFKNPSQLPKKGCESFETLFDNEKVKIEKILSNELIDGQWYEQNDDEWVILLQGNASLEFEDYTKELACGNYVFIPKQTKHRVLKTSKNAIWLAVHIN
ncbi:MAG: cupin [Campylobacterales bacterium]|nr:cupin [Campylobacterales bacterium]